MTDVGAYPSARPFLKAPKVHQVGSDAKLERDSVILIKSPFPKRRPTIYIEACDRVIDEVWEEIQKKEAEELKNKKDDTAGQGSSKKLSYDDFYVFPTMLPSEVTKDDRADSVSFLDGLDTKVINVGGDKNELKKTNPYQNLVYLFDETATLFTSLFCSLAHNTFTYKSARKNLTETQFSFKYAKRPLMSDFVNINVGKFQKMNQIPKSGLVSRKDELHFTLQQRRANNNTQGSMDATPNTNIGRRKRNCQLEWFEKNYLGGQQAHPSGWVLPRERQACETALRHPSLKGKLYIVKKVGGTGGLDIFLVRAGSNVSLDPPSAASRKVSLAGGNSDVVQSNSAETEAVGSATTINIATEQAKDTKYIVQEYLDRPYLIHGHKFDLRLYVLITSYYPFRMYIYREGLVRIATGRYTSSSSSSNGGDGAVMAPIDELTSHLTNFTLNKQSENFHNAGAADGGPADSEELSSFKWPFAALKEYMEQNTLEDGSAVVWDSVFQKVKLMLVEVFTSITPQVRSELFEIDKRQRAAPKGLAGSPVEVSEATQNDVSLSLDGTRVHLPSALPCTCRGISPYFQLFGVDVLLHQQKSSQGGENGATEIYPSLIEINGMPSLSSHYSYVDQCIKGNLVPETLTTVGLTTPLIKTAAGTGGNNTERGNLSKDTKKEAELEEKDVSCPFETFFNTQLNGCPTAVEACMTLEEEIRRGKNFDCVFPSVDGWEIFKDRFKNEKGEFMDAIGKEQELKYDSNSTLTPLDYVLCKFMKEKATSS